MIAEHARLDMDAAFAALRLYARNKNERLVDVAHAVAARTLPAADIAAEVARLRARRVRTETSRRSRRDDEVRTPSTP